MPGTKALAYYEKSKLTAVKSFLTLATGVNVIKLLKAVIYKYLEYARVFVPGKPFQLSLMFVGKTGAYSSEHLSVAPL